MGDKTPSTDSSGDVESVELPGFYVTSRCLNTANKYSGKQDQTKKTSHIIENR